MNRMKNVIYGQAERDSNYVHYYREKNTIMDRKSRYHSPYQERAASPYNNDNAYKDINDTDYTKTHKHKIVNNEPVKLEKSRSISNIFQKSGDY